MFSDAFTKEGSTSIYIIVVHFTIGESGSFLGSICHKTMHPLIHIQAERLGSSGKYSNIIWLQCWGPDSGAEGGGATMQGEQGTP